MCLGSVEVVKLCPMPPPTGEKMNEAEIDALMAGQEDENGCVNYEGKPPYSHAFPLLLNAAFSSSSLFFPPSSVLCPVLLLQPLSSTSCLCKDADHRTCADPLVSRHPLTVSCTTKGSGGTKKKDYAISISEAFYLFFCPNGAVFIFFSLPPALLNAEIPSFFNHHWFLQRNSNSPLHHVA